MMSVLLLLAACNRPSPPVQHDLPTPPTGASQLLPEGSSAGANLLILSLDTVAAGHVNADTMPYYTALAGQGVELTHNLTSGVWTAPSMSAFVIGASATELGAEVFVPVDGRKSPVLPPEDELLAETMQASGYTTYLLTGNDEFFGQGTWADAGYDVFEPVGESVPLSRTIRKFESEVEDLPSPWYAHFHIMQPHTPYIDNDEPETYYKPCVEGQPDLASGISTRDGHEDTVAGETWITLSPEDQANVIEQFGCLYDESLRWVDSAIFERMLGQLRDDGMLDDTLVVILSDHGEEIGEHLDPLYNRPNFGHNLSTHGQASDVIGAFLGPGVAPTTWTGLTNNGDFQATILSALDIAAPEAVRGIPVGMAAEDRLGTIYECGGYTDVPSMPSVAAVRDDGIKLIRNQAMKWEEYDTIADPDELDELLQGAPPPDEDADLMQAVEDLRVRALDEGWCGEHEGADTPDD